MYREVQKGFENSYSRTGSRIADLYIYICMYMYIYTCGDCDGGMKTLEEDRDQDRGMSSSSLFVDELWRL
jgi:hypothetical protein